MQQNQSQNNAKPETPNEKRGAGHATRNEKRDTGRAMQPLNFPETWMGYLGNAISPCIIVYNLLYLSFSNDIK